MTRIDLARAVFTASSPNPPPRWAAHLAQILPHTPDNSPEYARYSLDENPHKLSAHLMRSFLFQVSNKLSQKRFAENAEVRARCTLLVVLFYELRRVNTHAIEALMASMSPTVKAIRESLFEAAVQLSDTELLSQLSGAGTGLNTLAFLFIRFQLGHSGSIRRGKPLYFAHSTWPQIRLYNRRLPPAICAWQGF